MLPTTYQQFIHQSRYARWQEDKRRRETWPETVKRYFDFFEEHLKGKPTVKKDRKELEEAVVAEVEIVEEDQEDREKKRNKQKKSRIRS